MRQILFLLSLGRAPLGVASYEPAKEEVGVFLSVSAINHKRAPMVAYSDSSSEVLDKK